MVDPEQLKALRDIHMPLPVGNWPPSLFLIGVIAVLLIGCTVLGIGLVRWYRRYRFQRDILRELSHYEQAFQTGECTATIASDVSSLLKRVACVYFSREAIASLYGEAWYLFLKKTARQDDDAVLVYFTQIPYQKDRQVDLKPLFLFARRWLRCQFDAAGGDSCLK